MLINHARLTDIATGIMAAAGAPEDKAQLVAEHLVEANLKGHDSHGVGMIESYVRGMLRGLVQPQKDVQLLADNGAILSFDGGEGLGRVVGMQATEQGIARAKETGICCVALGNASHLGRIGKCLGVGVGWQESEYQALGHGFDNRGKRMDEAITLLRSYWSEESISRTSDFNQIEAMAMEPKPPQGKDLPIWIGGSGAAALRRVGQLGDGWLAMSGLSNEQLNEAKEKIVQHAEKAGRDPSKLGWQMMLDNPPRDKAGKGFYSDKDRILAAADRIKGLGFEWMAINVTAIFQSGARSVEALTDSLVTIHDDLHSRFD